MANTLIACGGTGAHVALAFLRLHALGDPLGFFRHVETTGRRMQLPDLYLVDQDSGDGADEAAPTAWQTLRRVLGEHPSRAFGDDAGRRWPAPREVTPLPVGADKALLTDGITTLGDRFPNSEYLNCILSAEQREIDFSRGMMGSPAVGASLFKLKSFDTRPDDPDINHDEVYNQLLGVKGRIAVAGSGVGGTGAAVGPTLARELSDSDERHVMAVMLLNWFQFDELAEHLGDDRIRAQRRNREMSENAHSGLRYYGNRLAEHAATVPVGIPRDAIESRRFTGDNHQPVHEVYPHAAAAICCLRQFLDEDAYSAGLYHLDAERPTALGPGTGLPGGGTVGDLASQARTLVATLETYEKVLASSLSTPVAPILHQLVGTGRQATSRALAELRKQYSENLDWLRKVTSGTPTRPRGPYTSEAAMRRRLADHPLGPAGSESPDRAAAEVFRWLARWIRDTNDTSEPTRPSGVYWPEIREDEGLTPSPREAGALQKVQADKVLATLDSFVDPELMSQNGWPDPVAAADYFRESLAGGRSADMRRLELLFAGLLAGELILRRTARGDHRAVSLDALVEHRRVEGQDGLAHYAIERAGGREVVGFTAPDTVLCPVPGLPESVWSGLWRSLTGNKPTDWKEAGLSWGRATPDAERIRAWINVCTKRHPSATPPAWTKVFDGVGTGHRGYGGGARLGVRWGDGKLIDVYLPTRDESWIPQGLPEGDADDFVREHEVVFEGDKRKFWRVELEIAGEGEVHGFWDDHLRHLQAKGEIAFFADEAERGKVYLVTWSDGYRLVTLNRTLVLRRRDIGIRSCIPMVQDSVPSSDVRGGDLYPHYPLRWRYFDLLRASGGQGHESLLSRLKRGASPETPPQPRIDDGRAIWRLPLRGRAEPMNFVVKQGASHKAHWMVWPRFHSLSWQAYYVFQHCSDRDTRVDALWLSGEEGRDARPGASGSVLSRTKAEDDRSYPVRFQGRAHAGGPPVALCARRRNEEIGVYITGLEPLKEAPARMQIGIDFGTSHTTAAVKLGDRPEETIGLSPELAPHTGNQRALSLHVSENMKRVGEPGQVLSQGTWFPRYVEKKPIRDLKGRYVEKPIEHLKDLWPSEILTLDKVERVRRRKPAIPDWTPVRDYVIPPVGVLRTDLAEHLIANFKWNTSKAFQGRETDLRRIYLDRIVEQSLAEAFLKHGRPSGEDPVYFTFTYPLRTPTSDVRQYSETLRGVLQDASTSLGSRLELHGDVGLFDESHAARVGTNRFGDVTMVGDLGGGTLDLLISAQDGSGHAFRDAADSAKLGGNVLLKLIADHEGALPSGWGEDADTRLAKLRAWVRAEGLPALFGPHEARISGCPGLGVRGFDESSGPREGRAMVGRYFFLVAEFMARNLTSYLATHWLPLVGDKDRESLRIRVYLRGNGWKLWHEDSGYDMIGRAIQRRVGTTADRLWGTIPQAPPLPAGDMWKNDHHVASQAGHAKTDVVRHVVGRSQRPESVRDQWFSHALVELARRYGAGAPDPVNWFEKVPFQAGGSGTTIEFAEIRPVLLLSGAKASAREEVNRLPVDLTRRINENLENGEWVGDDQDHFQAPIAAWVWEAVLERLVAGPSGSR